MNMERRYTDHTPAISNDLIRTKKEMSVDMAPSSRSQSDGGVLSHVFVVLLERLVLV